MAKVKSKKKINMLL